MNWKNTWILVGLAAALFAFISLYERRLDPSGAVPPPKPFFTNFKPTRATVVQIRRGTQFALTLQQTNGAWRLTKPFAYPAATFAVQSFLETLERAIPVTHISSSEMLSRKQTSADFGFDSAPVAVALERGEERRDIRFGARTTAGDQVYAEIVGQPGIFVVSADILDNKLPRTQNDWRDTALFHFGDEKIERCEITRSGAGFVLQLDPTNKLWRLARHRADQIQVRQLLDKIQAARASEFVTDDPRADGEAFGLQAPEFELTLASGTAAQKVQFGRSPPNDPGRVYARIGSHSNVVLVLKAVVDLLATPYSELRDRQLVAFAPELVDVIEARGEEPFTVRKNANGAWLAGETPADPVLVAQWLNLLSQLQVTEFVKDVVTDFAPFGLEPPQRQYTLYAVVTNAIGPTNVFIARLDFGIGTNATDDRLFARRWDEASVYAIRPLDFSHLPSAAWQLRNHRVWNFTTNQVAKFIVREGDATREVLRQPNGDWKAGPGWTREVNPLALDEIAFQFGELNAEAWIARGESARAKMGFSTNGTQLSVELRGEKPLTLTLEFGGLSPLRLPYALTTVDGQPAIFEFPWRLYGDVQSYFNLAPPAGFIRTPNAPAPAKTP